MHCYCCFKNKHNIFVSLFILNKKYRSTGNKHRLRHKCQTILLSRFQNKMSCNLTSEVTPQNEICDQPPFAF